jgi:hypothetical protein
MAKVLKFRCDPNGPQWAPMGLPNGPSNGPTLISTLIRKYTERYLIISVIATFLIFIPGSLFIKEGIYTFFLISIINIVFAASLNFFFLLVDGNKERYANASQLNKIMLSILFVFYLLFVFVIIFALINGLLLK